jgi:hypothetical protein
VRGGPASNNRVCKDDDRSELQKQEACDTVSDVQKSSYSLYVNDVSQNGVVSQEFTTTKPATLVAKWYLFNFANGLPAGTYVFHLVPSIRSTVVGERTVTVYVVDSCQYGTTNGLFCAPPPA